MAKRRNPYRKGVSKVILHCTDTKPSGWVTHTGGKTETVDMRGLNCRIVTYGKPKACAQAWTGEKGRCYSIAELIQTSHPHHYRGKYFESAK